MTTTLHTLAYFSRCPVPLRGPAWEVLLDDILAAADRNNPYFQVTGVLMASEGRFAQVLEGPGWAVESVFRSIERDPRHTDVEVLYCRPLTQRSFMGWSMGLISQLNPNYGSDVNTVTLELSRGLLRRVASAA